MPHHPWFNFEVNLFSVKTLSTQLQMQHLNTSDSQIMKYISVNYRMHISDRVCAIASLDHQGFVPPGGYMIERCISPVCSLAGLTVTQRMPSGHSYWLHD